MTKFLDKSFSTYAPGDRRYADNWERTFGKMKPLRTHEAPSCPQCGKPNLRCDERGHCSDACFKASLLRDLPEPV